MDGYQSSVMIALVPTTSDWCKLQLPHMTLAYVGEIPDLAPTAHNDLLKAAITLASETDPLTLDVIGNDVFGEGEKMVDVLLLRPDAELMSIQRAVAPFDVSEHPFKPHVTVGPFGSIRDTTPDRITFYRILVSWGEDTASFPMRKLIR